MSCFLFVESGPPCVPQVVITRQEAPSTDKRLREDLHKKVMSGDPVAARLPYAILTKMVTFSGWKRFEMNETLKFHGVTEMTFPSMMRRSHSSATVRGGSASRASLPGTQGYFLMQEDMKEFVTSQPAAGALFTIVLGELCDSSVATFWQQIEKHAAGGRDGGLTRATMRAACGEDAALHRDGGGHGVALPARRGDRGGEAVSWLAAGRRKGGCFVPCVSREALPGERLGLLVGAPRQQVAPGREARGCWPGTVCGPCGN